MLPWFSGCTLKTLWTCSGSSISTARFITGCCTIPSCLPSSSGMWRKHRAAAPTYPGHHLSYLLPQAEAGCGGVDLYPLGLYLAGVYGGFGEVFPAGSRYPKGPKISQKIFRALSKIALFSGYIGEGRLKGVVAYEPAALSRRKGRQNYRQSEQETDEIERSQRI